MSQSSPGTALITGASTGIGAVYADRLARRGHDLILVARTENRMNTLADKLRAETGRTVEVVAADLADRADLDRVEKVLGSNTAITMLVNNAGTTIKGGLLDNDTAAFADLIALNVTATTALAAAAAKAFKGRDSGTIVNIASTLVFAPEFFNGGEGTYSATKSFIYHLSQSLGAQFAGSNVRIHTVCPGATRTEIWSKAAVPVDALPQEMVMEVDDLVDAALAGLDSGEAITIPSMDDGTLFANFEQARAGLMPGLSSNRSAQRYRQAVAA